MTLDQLRPDQRAIVTALDCRGPARRRLLDLGLLPGTEVQACLRSPLGDPTAYLIRGSLIALRRSLAADVHVTPVGPAPEGREEGS